MHLAERRIGLLFAVFLTMLVVAASRATWLGTVKASTLKAAADMQQETTVTVPARRGSIVDRNGTELAISQAASSISANPYLIKEPAKVARELSPLLEVPEKEVFEKVTRDGTGFVYLARKVPQANADRISALHIEGIDLIPDSIRSYPRDWVAAQLLGRTGTDNNGLTGLEASQEKALSGTDGQRSLVRDGVGDPIRLRETKPARPGSDVRLTIDANIQGQAEEVLAEVGRQYEPKGATAIVMDPGSGELLALANWPRVNANSPDDSPDYAIQNRAVSSVYEPGSTFKAFTVAGALQEGDITPDTSFTLPPSIKVADRVIEESHARGTENMTTGDILKVSSNVGAITIGQRLGKTSFDRWVRRFGFGSPTGVDLPGEERGLVPEVSEYSGSSMGNLPIGQGVAVTPMQMATAYAAIANGGTLRAPHIIAEVGAKRTPEPAGKRIVSRHTATDLGGMLKGVTGAGGTASGAAIDGYNVSGKTGTANKVVNGTYSDTEYVASFVGFAPTENPRLLVTVMVDEPKGDIYGGSVAAPAFKQITSFALNYLKIPPQ